MACDVFFNDFQDLVHYDIIMWLLQPRRQLVPLRMMKKKISKCQILMSYNYLALALILRRFRCNRLVRFFFHFQRILAVDFLKGQP